MRFEAHFKAEWCRCFHHGVCKWACALLCFATAASVHQVRLSRQPHAHRYAHMLSCVLHTYLHLACAAE